MVRNNERDSIEIPPGYRDIVVPKHRQQIFENVQLPSFVSNISLSWLGLDRRDLDEIDEDDEQYEDTDVDASLQFDVDADDALDPEDLEFFVDE